MDFYLTSRDMRIRLALGNPFAEIKVLLPLNQDIKTIRDLKKYIFKNLNSVASVVPGWKELKLDIDGFELLPGSEVDIIQDGDVVR